MSKKKKKDYLASTKRIVSIVKDVTIILIELYAMFSR